MKTTVPVASIAIVVALKEEFAAVRAALPDAESHGVLLLRGGVGPESAARAGEQLLQRATPPRVVISSGFCGGLVDELPIGATVLATEILSDIRDPIATDAPLALAIREALESARVQHRVGALISVTNPVTRTEAKRALGISRKALAVDMETHALASALKGRSSVLAMRVISDSVLDELPPEIGGFLKPDGSVRIWNVAKFALKGNIGKLMELKKRNDLGMAALTAAWRAAWPAILKQREAHA